MTVWRTSSQSPLSCSTPKQSEEYSRSQLLDDVKDLLDVLSGLLPQVIGLLATHVCRHLSSFSSQSCWDEDEEGRVNSTQGDNGPNALILAHHPDSFIIIIMQSFKITEKL